MTSSREKNLKAGSPVLRDPIKLSKAEADCILDQIEEEISTKADAYPIPKEQFADLRKYRVGDDGAIYAILRDDILIPRKGHR
jgi:mRNA interferase RelE/StbE